MSGAQDNGVEDFDLGAALGANPGTSIQCFTVYVPNKDRDGKEIGTQRAWVLEAIRLLTELNGGATAMPPVEGTWKDEEGEIVWENPILVYSFIDMESFTTNIARVRDFLHRMGRETNQGEIAFEFGEYFYRISQFDAEAQP